MTESVETDGKLLRTRGWLVVAMLLAIGGCANKPEVVIHPAPVEEPPPPPEPPVVIDDTQLRRARLLADMLYDAKAAYDANRLMLPAGNNAYEIYQQVLQLDPGNAVAVGGIEEVALRYVALAHEAINQGKYDEAQGYLSRAGRLGPGLQAIADGHARLEQARQNKVEVHSLDAVALTGKTPEIMNRLAEIAQQIQRSEATFLINARSDEEGRWIYQTMRESVGGYRLRGNIDIVGTPSILVSAPNK